MWMRVAKIEPGMFSSERCVTFAVGDKTWSTLMPESMCDERRSCVRIINAGVDPNGKGWVRYWFDRDGESFVGLDAQLLATQIVDVWEISIR